MHKILLCDNCLSRFKRNTMLSLAQNNKDCFICKGALSYTPLLLRSALSQSEKFDWSTFSVASSLPKDVFIMEQELFDLFEADEILSIKNAVNASLIREIERTTSKKHSPQKPDITFEFNFIMKEATAKPNPIYIFGRYIKLSREHCQSRWLCRSCRGAGCKKCNGRENYPSVEGELGKPIAAAFGAENYTLHASGREDVDVCTKGTGRPFVLEILKPKKREADLQAIEKELSKNDIHAFKLKKVGKYFIDAVCNSHFEKEYLATVCADRHLTKEDAKKLEAASGTTVSQQTPNRVLGRRSDLRRQRKIFSISAKAKNRRLFLSILAEAGTYIKEFISGDNKRTRPSVSEILSCSAVCEKLDVISIRDYFLETIN